MNLPRTLNRVLVLACLTILAGCFSPHYVKVAPDKADAIISMASGAAHDYQAIYSGSIEINDLRLAVRFLAAFHDDNARFEIVPSSGAISIFSMARRGNKGEILLPSVARGQYIDDLNEYLSQSVRTANFIKNLPELLLQKLPVGNQTGTALMCSEFKCRLEVAATEVFEIDPATAKITKASFRDKFQQNDRVVLSFEQDDALNISIPELGVKMHLRLTKREPLIAPSSKRFRLNIPDSFSELR